MAGAPPIPDDIYSLSRAIAQLRTDLNLLRNRQIPLGSLPPELLTDPLIVKPGINSVASFAVDTSSTARAEVAIPIPEGFSRAIVSVNAFGRGVNSSGGVGTLNVQARAVTPAVSQQSTPITSTVAAGGTATAGTALVHLFENLDDPLVAGLDVTISTVMFVSAGTWAADALNRATTNGFAMFLR
jgi:hypothetical protein